MKSKITKVRGSEILAALLYGNGRYAAVSFFANQVAACRVDSYPDVQVFPTGSCIWFTNADLRPETPIVSLEEASANAAETTLGVLGSYPVPALLIGRWKLTSTGTDKEIDRNLIHLLGWDETLDCWKTWPEEHDGLLWFLKASLYPTSDKVES